MPHPLRPLAALGAALALALPAAADTGREASWLAGQLRVATGVDFSRGDYDESKDTDVVYVPFTVGYLWDELPLTATRGDQIELRVTVPYLYVNGVLESGAEDSQSEDGLGDILVRAAYLYYPQVDWPRLGWLPVSEWGVQVKIPTASDDDGLGTGETDVSIDLTLFQRFGDFVPYATGGYRFIGDDTPDYDLQNGAFASVGASWVPRPATSLGLGYDWRESISKRSRANGSLAANGDAHELSLFGSLPLGGGLRVSPYAVKGLSSGSPDFAVGVQLELTVPIR